MQDELVSRLLTEDVANIVHHHIHTRELRPDLCENTNVCSIDHLGLEEFEVAHICVASLEFDHIADLLQLEVDKWCISVALGVDQSKHIVAVFPPIFLCEPSLQSVSFFFSITFKLVTYLETLG